MWCAARGGTSKTSTRTRAARNGVSQQHPGIWFWRPDAKTPLIYYLLSFISYLFLSPLMSLFCAAKTYIKIKGSGRRRDGMDSV